MRDSFFLFILLGLALGFEGGCAPTASFLDPSLTLGPPPTWETSRAFQKAVQSQPGSRALEQTRIDYLLERVSKSPYNFIRNGSRYTGKRTEAHLRWKHFRQQRQVKTAEEFIDRVASYSKMSGQSYWVVFPDKKRYELHPLLLHELELLDQALERERERMKQTPAVADPEPAPQNS